MEKIELINYRCFKHLPLSFKTKVNLLIGDNSSGKTTLMRALSAVLNSFFSGYSDENTRFFGLSKDDFTIAQTDTGLANELPITINFKIFGIDATLELRSKKGRTLQTPLLPIAYFANKLYEELFNDHNQQINPLPLFAGFSTNDIHSSRKISAALFKKYDHMPSIGYYECMSAIHRALLQT